MPTPGCDGRGRRASRSRSPTVRRQAWTRRAGRYVALGDSWPYGGHCGGCSTFVSYYAADLEARTGQTVNLSNMTQNGGGTAELVTLLEEDEAVRAAVAAADVVVIATGVNDLDSTGTLDEIAAGGCADPAGDTCIRAMGVHWRRGFETALDSIDALTDQRDVTVRLIGTQNVFLSDPTLARYYGLPASFALGGGEDLTRLLRDAICDAAERHEAACVDVWTLFNGRAHDQEWDENSDRAHRDVAQAILDTGLD